MKKRQNKAEELILRMFKMIARNHFEDHKMIPHYCNSVHFERGIGDDIGNWVQAYYSNYYHATRKRIENEDTAFDIEKKMV